MPGARLVPAELGCSEMPWQRARPRKGDAAREGEALPVPPLLPRSGHREPEHSPAQSQHGATVPGAAPSGRLERRQGNGERLQAGGGDRAQPGGWAGAWLSHIFMAGQGFMVRL